MIYASPGNTFTADAFDAPTGQTMEVGIRDESDNLVTPFTSAGVTEITVQGQPVYRASLVAPDTEADYFVVFRYDSGTACVYSDEPDRLRVTSSLPDLGDAFVSVGELGDYLGRDLSADAGAELCVAAACDFCRDVAEQHFNEVLGETIYMDGTGTDALLLPELPVTRAGTVSVSDSSTPPTWTTAGTADYALNGNGILYATNTAGTANFGTTWPAGRQNVRVTYDHGYTAGDSPRSVRMVALAVASRLLVQGPAMFEQLGDSNVRYAAESTALMPTERAILRKHRRTH